MGLWHVVESIVLVRLCLGCLTRAKRPLMNPYMVHRRKKKLLLLPDKLHLLHSQSIVVSGWLFFFFSGGHLPSKRKAKRQGDNEGINQERTE